MNTAAAPDAITDIENALRQLLPVHVRDEPLNRRLSELGLDSIDVVDLLCALDEDFQVRLTTDEFTEDTSIAGLARLVSEKIEP